MTSCPRWAGSRWKTKWEWGWQCRPCMCLYVRGSMQTQLSIARLERHTRGTPITNTFTAGHEYNTAAMFTKDERKTYITTSPSSGEWFSHFKRGMKLGWARYRCRTTPLLPRSFWHWIRFVRLGLLLEQISLRRTWGI